MQFIRDAGKVLAGGCVVYTIMAACSAGSGSSGGPTPNVDAQSCNGTCTIQGVTTVAIEGIPRANTADTDPAQAVGASGAVDESTVEVATGPFYLTDVMSDRILYVGIVPVEQPCQGAPAFKVVSSAGAAGPSADSVQGARIFVAPNEKLCLTHPIGSIGPADFRWAGFRPYEG